MPPIAADPQMPTPDDPVLRSDLFVAFPPDAHAALVSAMTTRELASGAVLFEQDEPGDSLYLVRSGRVGVLMRADGINQFVAEYGAGEGVGELSLVTGKPRTAQVVALADTVLWRLTLERWADLTERYPEAVGRFLELLQPRLRRSQLVAVLIGLFGQLPPSTLATIVEELVWHSLPSGAELFRQGDPGDSLAIVVTGRLQVVVADGGGRTRVVSEFGRGQSVGELAVLTGEPRSATVVALRDTDVALLGKAAFDRLLMRHPQVMLRITQLVVDRLRRTTSAAVVADADRGLTIALVGLSASAPVAVLAEQLAGQLAAIGATMHLNSAILDAALSRPGHASLPEDSPVLLTLNTWLTERESEHRFVLYEADQAHTTWTERCLRRADLILLVGMAGGEPAPTQIEELIGRRGVRARRELVLVHPEHASTITATRRWLDQRSVSAHHHVRVSVPADVRRLARVTTGHGVGLVLSGGGARGFAHIGVIRALEEAGITPDMAGGSSAGGLIAALYATGRGWQEIDALGRRMLGAWRRPDYTLPLVSLLRGDRLTTQLREIFQDAEIEDLWRGFFCLSVSLTRLRVVEHREGQLWRAIRASTSLPLIFPPLLEQGEILVDGGVVDNLPAGTMRAMCPQGVVIGVDVSQENALSQSYRFGPSLSGWRMALSRLQPAATRLRAPSIVDTLMRVLEYSAVRSRHANATFTDLVIRPPVDRFGTLEFSAYDTIVEAGYQAARAQIAAWQVGSGASPDDGSSRNGTSV